MLDYFQIDESHFAPVHWAAIIRHADTGEIHRITPYEENQAGHQRNSIQTNHKSDDAANFQSKSFDQVTANEHTGATASNGQDTWIYKSNISRFKRSVSTQCTEQNNEMGAT